MRSSAVLCTTIPVLPFNYSLLLQLFMCRPYTIDRILTSWRGYCIAPIWLCLLTDWLSVEWIASHVPWNSNPSHSSMAKPATSQSPLRIALRWSKVRWKCDHCVRLFRNRNDAFNDPNATKNRLMRISSHRPLCARLRWSVTSTLDTPHKSINLLFWMTLHSTVNLNIHSLRTHFPPIRSQRIPKGAHCTSRTAYVLQHNRHRSIYFTADWFGQSQFVRERACRRDVICHKSVTVIRNPRIDCGDKNNADTSQVAKLIHKSIAIVQTLVYSLDSFALRCAVLCRPEQFSICRLNNNHFVKSQWTMNTVTRCVCSKYFMIRQKFPLRRGTTVDSPKCINRNLIVIAYCVARFIDYKYPMCLHIINWSMGKNITVCRCFVIQTNCRTFAFEAGLCKLKYTRTVTSSFFFYRRNEEGGGCDEGVLALAIG